MYGFDAVNNSRIRISHRIVNANLRAGKGNQFIRIEIPSNQLGRAGVTCCMLEQGRL
jgi:hypothetical protein